MVVVPIRYVPKNLSQKDRKKSNTNAQKITKIV